MNIDKCGRICVATLEFYATDTCNLSCEHCHSPFLTNPNFPDLQILEENLAYLAPILRAQEIKILGGEPLLNKQLCEILRVAKTSQVFERIRVATNGVLLSKMNQDFWELTDIVEVASYPSAINSPSILELIKIKQIAHEMDTILEIWCYQKFQCYTTAMFNENPSLISKIYSSCAEVWKWGNHLLYDRNLYRCSRVHTLDRYLNELGVQHVNFTKSDGLLINGRESLAQEINEYLNSLTPLASCSYCLGTSGKSFQHRQLSSSDISKWKEKKSYPVFKDNLLLPGLLTWTHRQPILLP